MSKLINGCELSLTAYDNFDVYCQVYDFISWHLMDSHMIKTRYIMVEYDMILDTKWKEENQNFVQTMNSQKTLPTLPLWVSYGASSEFLGEKIPCHMKGALYLLWLAMGYSNGYLIWHLYNLYLWAKFVIQFNAFQYRV